MSLVTDEFRQQSHVISETFPDNVDVYYMFVDRVLEDVVSIVDKRISLQEE